MKSGGYWNKLQEIFMAKTKDSSYKWKRRFYFFLLGNVFCLLLFKQIIFLFHSHMRLKNQNLRQIYR
jgi:hypothetical protein